MPGAPLEATDISKDKVTLSWKPSPKDGGSPITGYIIESRESWKTTWISAGKTDGDTFKITIGKLKDGQDYYFRVCAENSVGKSDFLETSKGITPQSPHGMLMTTFCVSLSECLIFVWLI